MPLYKKNIENTNIQTNKKYTTILIRKDTLTKLKLLKIHTNLRNISDVIELLIQNFENQNQNALNKK